MRHYCIIEFDGWFYRVSEGEEPSEVEYCYRDRPIDNKETIGKAEKS